MAINADLVTNLKVNALDFYKGFDKAKRAAEDFAGRFDDAFTQVDNSINRSTKSFNDLISSVRKGFVVFTLITAATRIMKASAEAAAAFAKEISDLQAITQIAGKDLQDLTAVAKQWGKETAFGAAEVAKAFRLVASANGELTPDQLKEVTKQVITLATATGMDLDTAANTVTNTLGQFNLTTDNSNRIINTLAAGSRVGKAEVDNLGRSLKYVGSVAGSSSVSLEETVAVLELLASAGIKNERAGTAVRGIITRLNNQDVKEFRVNLVGMEQALLNIAAAGPKVNLTDLFGKNFITEGTILVQQVEKLARLKEQVTGTGDAYEMAGIKLKSYDVKLKQFENSWENLKVSLQEFVLPESNLEGFTTFLNTTATILSKITEKSEQARNNFRDIIRFNETSSGVGLFFQGITGNMPEKPLQSDLPSISIALAQNRLAYGFNNVEEKLVSFIPSADKFLDAFDGVTKKLKSSLPSIQKLIDERDKERQKLEPFLGKNGEQYLQEIVKKPIDAMDEGFTDIVNSIFTDIRLGRAKDNMSTINSQIEALKNIAAANAPGTMTQWNDKLKDFETIETTNRGMIQSISFLEKQLALLAGGKNQKPEINIYMNGDSVAKSVMFTSSAQKAIEDGMRQLTAKEARAVAR